MSTPKFLKGLAAVSAGAALAVGVAVPVHAQNVVTVVPGDNGDGRTVAINRPGMDVRIVDVDRAAGTVQVSLTNTLGFQVYCEAPSQDAANRPGGSVSTAPVVEKSIDYYSRFQNTKAEQVAITMAVLGSTGTMTIPLWPLTQFAPQGSLGEMASPAVQLRSEITEGNTAAKVNGLFGTTTAFVLNNGANTTRTITLGPPATSPRGEDKVGFFTVCAQGGNSAAAQGTAQLYAWSAYEEGWPPPFVEPEGSGSLGSGSLDSGSLDSGSLGSLGSSGSGPTPPVGGGPGDGGDGGGDTGDGGDGGADEGGEA